MDGFIAFITADTLKVIWSGLKVTLLITAAGLLLGTLLAALLCAASRSKIIVLRVAEKAFSVVVRGTPVLMLLLLLFYVVFARTGMSAIMVAIIGFGLNTAAHVSEIMKSALMAVDAGQVKAARTLGFSAWQAFWYVTFPQAVAFALPMYRNATINLLQWTSVVGYVTISDLTRVINQLGARSAKPFYSLFLGIVIYLFVGYMIHLIFKLTERKGGRVR
ncbi:MAG: ABC transporter permease subunit [Clostridia bacterium]|nr:ABC transporter permease subunit [Clostridia bacterium]